MSWEFPIAHVCLMLASAMVAAPETDHLPNGIVHDVMLNGIDIQDQPSSALFEQELPQVQDGQVPLKELIQRVIQNIYADLINYSET